jgi:hypothetical protein
MTRNIKSAPSAFAAADEQSANLVSHLGSQTSQTLEHGEIEQFLWTEPRWVGRVDCLRGRGCRGLQEVHNAGEFGLLVVLGWGGSGSGAVVWLSLA